MWDAGDEKEPVCGTTEPGPKLALPAGWTATFFRPSWGRGEASCELALAIGGKTFVLEVFGTTCGNPAWSFCEARAFATQLGAWTAIVTTNVPPRDSPMSGDLPAADHQLRICTAPAGALACSEPMRIGSTSCRGYGEGSSGADGLVLESNDTRLDPKISGDMLTLELAAPTGTLDATVTSAAGRYPIVRR